jgi:hypothetical protein
VRCSEFELFDIARVFIRLNHVARVIVNANTALFERLRCVAYPIALLCVRFALPQATKWQRIGNQIDAAIIFR